MTAVRLPPPNDPRGQRARDELWIETPVKSRAGVCVERLPGKPSRWIRPGALVAASSMRRASRATPIISSLRPSSVSFLARSLESASVDTQPTVPRASPTTSQRRLADRSHHSRRRWSRSSLASISATRRRSISAQGAPLSPIAWRSAAASANPLREPRRGTRSHSSMASRYLWCAVSSITQGLSAPIAASYAEGRGRQQQCRRFQR